MSKKRGRENRPQDIIKTRNFSSIDYVEIQSEAYYRALKRIEKERNETKRLHRQGLGKERHSKKEIACLILNFAFRPRHLQKISKTNIADSLLNIIMASFFLLIGYSMRILGFIVAVYTIYESFSSGVTMKILYIVWCVAVLILGGFFIAASIEIENEKNYEKLYTYSASIMAVFAVIISSVALFI